MLEHKRYHHHQFLMPAIWRRWVPMNDLHCPRSFVKSIAPLNVSSIESMSSFTLSNHRSLGLPFVAFGWLVVFRLVAYRRRFASPSFSSRLGTGTAYTEVHVQGSGGGADALVQITRRLSFPWRSEPV